VIDLSVTIDVKEALDALARVADPAVKQRMAERIDREVLTGALAQYPQPSRAKQAFASDASRRFFFAALRSGRITVPYRRTGGLGANWGRVPSSDGLTLRSTMPYGAMVRSVQEQARYFKGIWPTDQQIATEREADAALAATAELVEIIGDAGP
jgi:hypothetical protein